MSHTWSKPIPRVRLRVIAIGKLGQVGRRVTCTSLSGHVYEADLPAQWFRASKRDVGEVMRGLHSANSKSA